MKLKRNNITVLTLPLQKTEPATGGVLSQKGVAWNFIKKETLAQVFSCEICEISKNTFFTERLRRTASEKSHQESLARGILLKDCSEKINKIPEARKSKIVNLKPGAILIKDFVAGAFLVAASVLLPKKMFLRCRDSESTKRKLLLSK